MAKVTQTIKTGMTVITGGNVPAYTLEYLTPSKKKRAGEFETIVVPYIELGRANNCNILYGDESPTVSRRHAAIERRGNDYYLTHLSQTNPSLINGKPVVQEAKLNNGDEIQLSMEGPKLRFNATPAGTSKMGFTKKINLLIKQSTRQYRTAMYSLMAALVIVALVGAWFIYSQHGELKNIRKINDQLTQQRKQDSIKHIQEVEKNAQTLASLKQSNEVLQAKTRDYELELKRYIEAAMFPEKIYDTLKDNIYFLEVRDLIVTTPSGEAYKLEMGWTGTAFLCNDGKLVTARHCIQSWRFSQDLMSVQINAIEVNGGKISVRFRATSDKDWFEFNLKDVVFDDTNDNVNLIDIKYDDGSSEQVSTKAAFDMASDWAYYQTNRTSNLIYDKELSKNLKAGEKLYVFGFSLSHGGPQEGKVRPLFSDGSVAQSGLTQGIIVVSNKGYESGNSGGPVIVKADNNPRCIGIVSYSMLHPSTGAKTNLGGLVPIANIK